MTCPGMAFFPANFMLQTSNDQDEHHQPPILTSCTPQDHFHGVGSLLGKRSMSFSGVDNICDQETNGEDDLSDDGSQMGGEKKRRLNMEQVKTLEKNFELGNKLEPERKMQLARALGLQPRQVAIWFQNRRARWKTKQLEKDYDILKRQFEAIKAENEALQDQNNKLHAEVVALKNREPTESINLNKETEGSSSNRSENSSDINLDISNAPEIDSPLPPPPPTITTTTTHHHLTSRPFFPSSLRPAGVAQLFQNSTRQDFQNQRIDHNSVKEESLCNMFGIDDQNAGFWPWLE